MEDTTHNYYVGLVGLFLTLIVIAWGYSSFQKASSIQNAADKNTTSIQQSLSASPYDKYINAKVYGQDVISAINLYANSNFGVLVRTEDTFPDFVNFGSSTGSLNIVWVGSSVVENVPFNLSVYDTVEALNAGYYIIPTASFTATIGYSPNGTVNAIKFFQN